MWNYPKIGIDLTSHNGVVSDLLVGGNIVTSDDDGSAIGIKALAPLARSSLVNVKISANQIDGCDAGIVAGAPGTGSIYNLDIDSNQINSLAPEFGTACREAWTLTEQMGA